MKEALLRLARALLGHPANEDLRRRLAGDPHAAESFHRQALRLLLRLLFVRLAREQGDFRLQISDCRFEEASGSLFLKSEISNLQSEIALVGHLPGLEHLDEAYQDILECHPVLDVASRRFDLVEADGHHRKITGSYYTPARLVECLLASTLDPVLEEALGRSDPEKQLLALRICDPACGSGRFLVAAGRRLAARLAALRGGDYTGSLRDVLANCLHGMDRDPLAVELCRLTLWLEGSESEGKITDSFPLHSVFPNISCGNSLLSLGMRDEGRGMREDRKTDDSSSLIPLPSSLLACFDVVLVNPPWERFKLQDREWFAARCPAVAAAPDAHSRRQLIQALREKQPELFAAYREAARQSAAESRRIRDCGRYPLSARGDLNAYAPFVELSRRLLREGGRAGLIVPSGLATDDTLKALFQDLLRQGQVVSWYDFHNRGRLFPGVQGNIKFGLLTLSTRPQESFTAAGQLDDPARLSEPGRTYRLSAAAIARLNPNTLHCPSFASACDADLVGRLHERFPVLVRSQEGMRDEGRGMREDKETGGSSFIPHPSSLIPDEIPANPWGLRLTTMFHMTHDAALFRRLETLQAEGWRREGNVFRRGQDRYLPLYEAKLVRAFNHRAATFAGVEEAVRFRTHARTRSLAAEELADPRAVVLPRYWVPEQSVLGRGGQRSWFLGFRNAISAVADARSLVAAIIPCAGVGNSLPLILGPDARTACLLLGLLNSFVLDYVLRQKASGGNLNFHVFRQLPVPPPEALHKAPCPWSPGETLADWIGGRVLELTYTSWELGDFARECGCGRPPFAWDEERRRQLRSDIDAACFVLYDLGRPDIEHVLGTFPVARCQEIRQHGRWLSRELILERLDRC
jgi:hypothetical protein